VAEHGARAVCRNVLVPLRQSQLLRGPVVAGVIRAIGERPAQGVRTSQDVMLIARNLVAPCIERGGALDIVTVALLVAMQIGHVAAWGMVKLPELIDSLFVAMTAI
jgi:hypothetical protein